MSNYCAKLMHKNVKIIVKNNTSYLIHVLNLIKTNNPPSKLRTSSLGCEK